MKRHVSRLSTFFLALIAIISTAACASEPLELVQSVPVETTLAVPGIRQAQQVWLELINGAQTSLDIEQFYVSDQAGEALEPVLKAIATAAGRGVHVRFMVDAKMFKTYPDSVTKLGALNNVEARTIDYSSLGGIQHAKFFIVDGKQAFLGSQNFDWRALSHIHEIGVRIADPAVCKDLGNVFEKDWADAEPLGKGPKTAVASSILFAQQPGDTLTRDYFLVASPARTNPPGTPDTISQVTSLIDHARTSVQVQVMEYTTATHAETSDAADQQGGWRVLDNALRAAAKRGAHVQLMIDATHVKTAKKDLTSLAALGNVEVRAVTIPQWSGGPIDYARLIHSKYLIVDGTAAWVGTENWSQGYFMNTRNVGLVLHLQPLVDQLGQVFSRVWTSAYSSEIK